MVLREYVPRMRVHNSTAHTYVRTSYKYRVEPTYHLSTTKVHKHSNTCRTHIYAHSPQYGPTDAGTEQEKIVELQKIVNSYNHGTEKEKNKDAPEKT